MVLIFSLIFSFLFSPFFLFFPFFSSFFFFFLFLPFSSRMVLIFFLFFSVLFLLLFSAFSPLFPFFCYNPSSLIVNQKSIFHKTILTLFPVALQIICRCFNNVYPMFSWSFDNVSQCFDNNLSIDVSTSRCVT